MKPPASATPRPELPDYSRDELAAQLAAVSPEPLEPSALEALFAHYQELRRWNRTLSLVGPGTVEEVIPRHYGESLAALPLVPAAACSLLDLGSGAGFPGLVLAAARPDLAVTLVEARERKWAFLQAAVRRGRLSCRCLNARVGPSLPADFPQQIDLLTMRALKPGSDLLAALASRLSLQGRILFWAGGEAPSAPPGWEPRTELPLPGSDRRRLVSLERSGR